MPEFSKFHGSSVRRRGPTVSPARIELMPSGQNAEFGMNEKYWYLKNCPVFAQLTAEQVQEVEQNCFCREFARGDVVYLPHDMGDSVMLLARGRVRLYHVTGEGKLAILGFVEPSELFGELSAFSGNQRDEHAEAMEKTLVVLVPSQIMQQVMSDCPSVSMKMTQLFGVRLRRVERRLKSLLFRSSRERLVHLLLELAERYGQAAHNGIRIGQRISHQDMASIIGATRETVTIALGELQAEGVIDVERRHVTLKNVNRLMMSIDFGPFAPAIIV
jgi:CRP/FNR family cyclic AMP-dependent transcriptional regulator